MSYVQHTHIHTYIHTGGTHLRLHHVVPLSPHAEDKVEDVDASLLVHHLHHGLDGDQRP